VTPGFHDTAAVALDPSAIPGALQVQLERHIPGFGTIRYEYAPAGYLTAQGEVRQRDHRVYHFRPDPDICEDCEGDGRDYSRSERGRKCPPCGGTGIKPTERLTSVTTLIGQITPKDGLAPWSEARGIEGAVEAVRLRIIDPDDPASAAMAVGQVRAHRLGADRARDDAADRGLDIHGCLEEYMRTGTVQQPAREEHRGYWLGLTRWLAATDLEPEEVEQIVASPGDGYAGRLDLVARCRSERVLFDAKTNDRGQIWPGAHLQVQLLERARRVLGDPPADRLRVVVFAADGEFREMDAVESPGLVDHALAFGRALRPVTRACDAANRLERAARRAAA